MKNDTILKTDQLAIGYAYKKENNIIGANINIDLQKGKLIALIGANGIGKSTLLRTLTGIQKPILGTVFLEEKSIQNYTALALAQKLTIVLTEKLPPSNLTIFDLVALGRQPYTNWIGQLTITDIKKINEAIALTNIENFIHKKHYEISDGQLQKAMITRALAQDNDLIILDEPTTHLDLLHKVNLLKLLKKLTKETNKCILFSTHDIDLAIQLSDEMIVMTDKKIIQDTPCQLISKGVFSELFQHEKIIFDTQKGKFDIQN